MKKKKNVLHAEAEEFVKMMKQSEYSVVEQLRSYCPDIHFVNFDKFGGT